MLKNYDLVHVHEKPLKNPEVRNMKSNALINDIQKGKIGKIALLKGGGIGDVIAFIPTLRKVIDAFPNAQITILTNKSLYFKKILKSYLSHIKIMEFEKNGLTFLHTIKAIRKIRKENFDLTICNVPTTKTGAMLSYLSGARYRVGYKDDVFSFLYNIKVNSYEGNIVELGLSSLKALGLDIKEEDKKLELFFHSKKHDEKIDEILRKNNIFKEDMLIAFHVGARAGHFTRFWLDKRWAEVADALVERYKAKILFIGGPDDFEKTENVLKLMKHNAHNFVAKFELDETAILIKKCDLLICTNSGPMHIAAALHTPLITLCGPSIKEWDPYSKNAYIIRKQVCALLCDAKYCKLGDTICMTSITVQDVLEAVEMQIKRFELEK